MKLDAIQVATLLRQNGRPLTGEARMAGEFTRSGKPLRARFLHVSDGGVTLNRGRREFKRARLAAKKTRKAASGSR